MGKISQPFTVPFLYLGYGINYLSLSIKKFFMEYPDSSIAFEMINKYYTYNNDEAYDSKATIVMFDGRLKHGGLNERLKGIMVSYYLSKKNKRRFYINWVEPFNLEDYLMPNKIDWRIDPNNIHYNRQNCFPVIMRSNVRQLKIKNIIERLIFKSWFKRKKELHVYSNLNMYRKSFNSIFNELFKPSPILEKELQKYAGYGKYWSFSFRFKNLLGDFNEFEKEELDDESKSRLIRKNIDEFIRVKDLVPNNYRIFISSDSETFLKEIRDVDERIFVSEGRPIYTDTKDKDEQSFNSHLKTFVDFYLIMGAEKICIFLTGDMHNSGYTCLASQIAQKKRVKHYF